MADSHQVNAAIRECRPRLPRGVTHLLTEIIGSRNRLNGDVQVFAFRFQRQTEFLFVELGRLPNNFLGI